MPDNLSDFGISYRSNQLVLTSAPQYRLNFNVTDADKFANVTVKVTDPRGVTKVLTNSGSAQEGGVAYYLISDIPAVYLLSNYTLTFEDGSGATTTATVSEGNYVYNQLTKDPAPAQVLLDLVTSMYHYWNAANAFWPQN